MPEKLINSPKETTVPSWLPPPENLTLNHGEVHVWRSPLNVADEEVLYLRQTLSSDEHERAKRYHFEKDRKHFIVAHGLLRIIVGRYLDRTPDGLSFCYGPYGKPFFVGEPGQCAIHFNLSHSDGLGLYAIARAREVGVDVERLRPDFPVLEVAKKFFSPREVTALVALPERLHLKAFFSCWTRKEAYIKARGEGLTLPLDSFEVSFVPGEPAALLCGNGDPKELSRWSLRELEPGASYVAALAAEGHDWELKCWQWPGKFDQKPKNERVGFGVVP